MMPAASNKTEQKTSSEASDGSKYLMVLLDKKVRNLEKRKSKLEAIKEKKAAGDILEKEQQETLEHYEAVIACLELARELQKQFTSALVDVEKQQKKQVKREKQERAVQDLKRTEDILRIQVTMDALGSSEVREHFKSGKHGAVVLTEDNLTSIDDLYKLTSPPAAGEEKFEESLGSAAEHLNSLVEAKERPVASSSFKELSDLLRLISTCGYFERAREAEDQEKTAVSTDSAEEPEPVVEEVEEEPPSVAEVPPSSTETFSEPTPAEVQPPVTPVPPPAPDMDDPSLSHSQGLPPSGVTAPHDPPSSGFVAAPVPPLSTSPTFFQVPTMEPPPPQQPPHVPPPKSRPLAEIVSQVEGTFSFLQESEIDLDLLNDDPAVVQVVAATDPAAEEEGPVAVQADLQPDLCVSAPHMDPAVVAAQPMMRPPSVPSQQPPPQTSLMPAPFSGSAHVDQPGEGEDSLSLSQHSLPPASLDYSAAANSQPFPQPGLSQTLSSGVVADAMFQPPVDDTPPPPAPPQPTPQQHASHGMMGQGLPATDAVAQYDLPPSIPLPPSQQAQQEASQLSGQEKKFQLNASATEFQSRAMYSTMSLNLQHHPPQTMGAHPPSQAPSQAPHPAATHPESRPMPPPGNVNADFTSAPNFAQAAGDFSQGGNFQGGGYHRGGRGGGGPGYRGGQRGGRGGNNNGNAMQNGFNNRPQNGNPRPSNRGGQGNAYQAFPPRNDYRPDSFQSYNSNGFGGGAPYQKRGGAGGPGYPRGGNNRGAGGMRGGVSRGGPPRGAGGNRGGMNRPGNQ